MERKSAISISTYSCEKETLDRSEKKTVRDGNTIFGSYLTKCFTDCFETNKYYISFEIG